MNKKFSTLLAGALLVTTAGAYAQIAPAPTTNGGFAKYVSAPAEKISNVEKGLVQLAINGGGSVLAMEAQSDGTFKLKVVDPSDASTVEVRNTLWTVVASGDGVSGYNYQLQNLGTGEYLAFNSDEAIAYSDETTPALPSSLKATILGDEVSSWTWLDTPSLKEGNNFEAGDVVALSSVFKSDSVLTLAGTTTLAADVEVVAVKYSNKNKPTVNGKFEIANQVKIVPVDPAPFLLGVNDLNSMLWKQDVEEGMDLKFNPTVNENEFDNVFEQKLVAEAAVGYPFRNYIWTIGDNYETNKNGDWGNKVADNLTFNELYKYDFYQAAETFAKAVKEAVTKDDQGLTVYSMLMAEYGWGASAPSDLGDAYTKILAKAEALDTKTNEKEDAFKVAVKNAMVRFIKTAKFAFVNKFDQSEYAGLPQWLDAQSVVGAVAGAASDGSASKKADEIKKAIDKVLENWDLDAKKKAFEDEKNGFADRIAANGWVSLKTEAGKYIMVDTTYMTDKAGKKYLRIVDSKEFKDLKANSNGESLSAANWTRFDMNGRFNFQFVYYPNQDSLVIRSAGFATLEDDENAGKEGEARYFKDLTLTNDFVPMPTIDGKDSETVGKERNLIKLQVLGTEDHRELTIGNSEFKQFYTPNRTINTRISLLDIANAYVKTFLPEGVYFINSVTGLNVNKNGKNLIADFDGSDLVWKNEENSLKFDQVQEYNNMPRTQWVVEKNTGSTNNIYNREYPQFNAKRVQFYKGAAEGQVFAVVYGNNLNGVVAKDTLAFTKVDDATKNIGYKVLAYDDLARNLFSLKYFNGLNEGNPVKISAEKELYVDPTDGAVATGFEFIPANMKDGKPVQEKYGYDGKLTGVANLYRVVYYVQDRATGKYLKNDGKDGYVLEADVTKASKFYFKENNGYLNAEEAWVPYYALVELEAKETPQADKGYVAGVNHPEYVVTVENITVENSIGAFAFVDDMLNKYRRLGSSVADEFENMTTDTAKFYMTNEPTRFLYENSANRTAENGDPSLNFLGVINKADRPENSMLPIFIDTAYVRNATLMPQYMLALGVSEVAATPDVPCPEHGMTCVHAVHGSKAYKTGRYLVALDDSIAAEPILYQGNFRLAFVDAKHIEDTLVIASSKYTGTKDVKKDSIMLNNDRVLNAATFAFLRSDITDETGDFYIEALMKNKAPQYVRVHNGVPVLVNDLAQAAKFNVTKTYNEKPVANEGIETAAFSVVATEGAVIVKGAEGKKVSISNVLGQTIANTVITSSEATISAPAGVVVVAVEGEAAVKAIVK